MEFFSYVQLVKVAASPAAGVELGTILLQYVLLEFRLISCLYALGCCIFATLFATFSVGSCNSRGLCFLEHYITVA